MSKIKDLKKGLETKSNETKFNDLEWLQNNNPADYIVAGETTTKKYNEEREEEIKSGLVVIADKFSVNPLLVELARWWEHKIARGEIKKLIDAEAEKAGFDQVQYLQEVLRDEVKKLADASQAINRMKYSVNYFKPRNAKTYKVPMKQISVEGVLYNIPVLEFQKARTEMKKAELIDFVKTNGTIVEGIESL